MGRSIGGRPWRRIRNAVCERDGWRCLWCGKAGRLEVDHIVPRSQGGTDDPANLRTLCRKCHGKRHAKVLTPGEDAWRRLVYSLVED